MSTLDFSVTAGTATTFGGSVLAVCVVAAGSGSRLGAGKPKAAVEVAGRTVLEWALVGIRESGVAARIVVTVPPGDSELSEVCSRYGALAVPGGATRAESVTGALAAIADAAPLPGAPEQLPTGVLVHDAARCFTPASVYHRVAAALEAGEKAVIPVLPVVDTIKTVDAAGYVSGTPARAQLRAVQTPQGFDVATLVQAHRDVASLPQEVAEAITDDAMLAETLGLPVATVEGAAEAFKITTPLDMTLAVALFEQGRLGS
ncbi:2-C-methyl-D-erythritol 4-phosphate cytidylyltransferase [Rothia nasimurium]|uniref:2-C-methyl-D-erythritol 4-phosphate cytidylyltransferase n=1 Tax=Rothia nasimurium TaxID=85336 RepID=UPI001F02BFFE|nr:2-C-methyl-D-erythritol 4-phosphate cytidylyltransferase [Rothia nasimurium]